SSLAGSRVGASFAPSCTDPTPGESQGREYVTNRMFTRDELPRVTAQDGANDVTVGSAGITSRHGVADRHAPGAHDAGEDPAQPAGAVRGGVDPAQGFVTHAASELGAADVEL